MEALRAVVADLQQLLAKAKQAGKRSPDLQRRLFYEVFQLHDKVQGLEPTTLAPLRAPALAILKSLFADKALETVLTIPLVRRMPMCFAALLRGDDKLLHGTIEFLHGVLGGKNVPPVLRLGAISCVGGITKALGNRSTQYFGKTVSALSKQLKANEASVREAAR